MTRDADYDYVIAGAGSAGCVLAARLSEDPKVRVLLVEAGPRAEPLLVRIPAAFFKLFRSRHDWAYETEPETDAGGRRLFMPRGKIIGGSSAINAMIYIRGNRLDYDGWAAGGAPGWSFAEVLPYFRKAEDQARGASEHHGTGGPLRVEDLRKVNVLSRAFVEACHEHGISRNDDFNGPSQDGAGFYQVTQRDGRRWSAANAYLLPALARSNLVLCSDARVLGIFFEGRRAAGFRLWCRGREERVRAAREVILCAGAIASPHLLMLSGVGPADDLRAAGIEPVHDLPGVGKNLQDHPIAGVQYRALGDVSLNQADGIANFVRFLAGRRGPLSSNLAEAGAFVRTQAELPAPDVQFHFAPVFFVNHGATRIPGHGFTIGPTLLSPSSRGRIALRPGDPAGAPLILGGHLSSPDDARRLLLGLRLARGLAASSAFTAWRGPELLPGTKVQSDADLETYLRRTVELLYHPSGTCKMGTDAMAVVDERLHVRGMDGLRVADASIMPTIPRGNTNAPTIMIAERLASFLR
jgi:choline dehydrogenase